MDTTPAPVIDPKKTEKSIVDEFMMSEYLTIASAHFKLHEGLQQSFRFYLGIVALPLTAAALILKDSMGAHSPVSGGKWAMLYQLPPLLVLVLGLTAVAGILMYLAMVNTRFNIVLYTRTVNAVRGYFSMRAKELGSTNFDQYLNLPTDKTIPRYREHFRADYWSFLIIILVNSVYAFIAALNVFTFCTSTHIIFIIVVFHFLIYEVIGCRRERKPISGLSSASDNLPPEAP